MDARVKLAAIDFNENISRSQAKVKKTSKISGNLGEKRFKFVCTKNSKEWVSKEVKEKKTYNFVDDLMKDLLKLKTSGIKLHKKKTQSEQPRNIAPVERPEKSIILAKKRGLCRFK